MTLTYQAGEKVIWVRTLQNGWGRGDPIPAVIVASNGQRVTIRTAHGIVRVKHSHLIPPVQAT